MKRQKEAPTAEAVRATQGTHGMCKLLRYINTLKCFISSTFDIVLCMLFFIVTVIFILLSVKGVAL